MSASILHFWRSRPRWYKEDGYLPVVTRSISHSSHNSSSSSSSSNLFFKDESTSTYHSYSTKSINSPTIRKLLFLALHIASLIFGAFGVVIILYYKHGHFMRVPVYSQYDIGQAGYVRPLLISSPPQHNQHQQLSAYTSEDLSNDDQRIAQPGKGTIFDTWTFPSSSSLSSDASSHTSPSSTATTAVTSDDQHLLILSPIRNAQHLLPTYFKHLENLSHPKQNTSIGFLLSDEEDETGILVQHWCEEQAFKGEYRSITLLRKDFGLLSPKGNARHEDWIQAQRRSLMARARTLLLTSTINPTHDWVFWLDVDVMEMPSGIISDLMQLGQIPLHDEESIIKDEVNLQAEEEQSGSIKIASEKLANNTATRNTSSSRKVLADVIIPNVLYRNRKSPLTTELRGYDLNNWAETPESIAMKATLDKDVILHEGDRDQPTYRLHLAREWVPPNVTLDPFVPSLSSLLPPSPSEHSTGPADEEEGRKHVPISTSGSSSSISNLYDPSSPAYIGRQIPLDAVGGVATLVRASVHLFGGVFPSWNVDHAVETEGFGVLAKMVGARIVGLPNYVVVHK